MIYIFYREEDNEYIEETVFPLLEDKEYKLVPFSDLADFRCKEEDTVMTYLNDKSMRELLPIAAARNWKTGILPHPDMKYVSEGLGVPSKIEEVVKEILNTEDTRGIDLFYCNGKLVLQSVNVGEVFELTGKGVRKGFFGQIFRFLSRIRKLPFLHHKPFALSTMEGEKIIDTSALGIIIAEHSKSSVVAKRLVTKDYSNDGIFHVFIISPQNILELISFLIKSIIPLQKKMVEIPDFIGHIKISNIVITNSSGIKYTIDGEKYEADEITIKADHRSLKLAHPSRNELLENAEPGKKSFKINTLPTGEKRKELTKRRLPWLQRATFEEFHGLFKVLRRNADLKTSYLVMMVLSALITVFGLYANSSPVIIGAMILAPLISPIVSFSMGVVRYDLNMLKSSLKTILAGTIASLFFAAIVSLFMPLKIITPEINARLSPNLLDLGIAIASGVAAAYAHAKEGIAKSLAGVAIAVALVPPLAISGIGIGWWDWEVFSGAFLLYLTNLSGIIMFAGLTFLFLGFAPFQRAKRGLIYSFIIILLICVPLSFTFDRIIQEAEITQVLEGSTYDDITLREVKVRIGSPTKVSLKLVAPRTIGDEEMQKIKEEIEKNVGEPVNLEVITAAEF